MPLVRPAASLLLCALLSIAVLPRADAADLDPREYEPVYVEKILEDWKVKEDVSRLVAVASNRRMRNVALLFKDGSTFRVYKDGKLLLSRSVENPQIPNFFQLTDDGVLIHYLEPTALYVNGKRVSSTTNTYDYSVGLQIEHLYRRGRVVFVDGRTIREYDVPRRRSAVLYRHPQDIAYARLSGNSVYYTAYDTLPRAGYYLFRNGKKYDYLTVANPWNFAISGRGTVYYFREGGGDCSLHRNGTAISSDPGICGFVFTDARENVWHVVAQPDKRVASGITAAVYKNGKPVDAPDMYNVEGWIGFGTGPSYAVRVLASPHDLTSYRLLKNGRLTGEPFDFSGVRDYNGVQFGPAGRTYMRNMEKGRWYLYEDGVPVYPETFEQVMFFRATSSRVVVIGTMPKGRR